MGVKIIVAAQKQMGGRISCSAQKCNKSGAGFCEFASSPPPTQLYFFVYKVKSSKTFRTVG